MIDEKVFGMIITDPEHWLLRLKWRDYHGIIAQQPPINPTMQSMPGLFWYLTSSCNGSIHKQFYQFQIKQLL